MKLIRDDATEKQLKMTSVICSSVALVLVFLIILLMKYQMDEIVIIAMGICWLLVVVLGIIASAELRRRKK